MNTRVLASSVPVRPAATVMLLRDGRDGLEVFMLQRNMKASFARGQYVFPGGRVDAADHAEEFEPICDGLDDAGASARLGLERGGLAWLVAAIRECFEEAGVLLARPRRSVEVVRFDDPEMVRRFGELRHQVHDGAVSLVDLCATEDLVLLTDRMYLVDHWVTPLGERRRFDTRFFLARAPEAQVPLHDDGETIASLWARPNDALEMWSQGSIQMFPPTIVSLRHLSRFDTAADALTWASGLGVPPTVLPKMITDDAGVFTGVVRPGEPGYDDIEPPQFVLGRPR